MKKKDLVDQLVSEIETGKVRTLGIYGHGASGKSTFAQELYQALDSTTVNLLETDPYTPIIHPKSKNHPESLP
ncbi:hypothetical protein ERS070019_00235 [Streptococcus pneumoniae]|uniref:hypothetical protein n=1 Tax=Streptococcus pneumoniae TaxID=1313 RepID=UPI0005EA4FA0|nr:hypothetical protein [Streptococcus pneumoniae]CTM47841.1 hypothetical protein ERS070019_00235 [Streptococcus pneumoniae]